MLKLNPEPVWDRMYQLKANVNSLVPICDTPLLNKNKTLLLTDYLLSLSKVEERNKHPLLCLTLGKARFLQDFEKFFFDFSISARLYKKGQNAKIRFFTVSTQQRNGFSYKGRKYLNMGIYASIKKPSCVTMSRKSCRPRLIRTLTAVLDKPSLAAISPSE